MTEPIDLDAWAYDRYVERPRRHGRDPVWESLFAEALQHAELTDKGEAV